MGLQMPSPKSKQAAPSRAIRLPEVRRLTGMSKATIWRYSKDDPKFPKPFKLSPSITVWDEGAVLAWLAAKQRSIFEAA